MGGGHSADAVAPEKRVSADSAGEISGNDSGILGDDSGITGEVVGAGEPANQSGSKSVSRAS